MCNALIAILLMALDIPPAAEVNVDSVQAADKAAINAVITDRFIAGWNAHDAHVFASAFAPDADFTNVRGVSASGRENIEQFHAQAFGISRPVRSGILDLVFTSSGGSWLITVMHNVDLTPVAAASPASK